MQKKNIIDLQTGLNKIEITHEDVGYMSGIFPIARLPVDSYVKNASFQIQTPFGASGGSALVNNNQAIPILYNFSLGYSDNSNYFIQSTATDEENQTEANIAGVNTGPYFNAPVSFDTPLNLNLRADISTRVWATGNNLNTARNYLAGAGTQSAALSFGGYNPSYLAITEEYDGTSWVLSNNLNTARGYLAGAGTQTAALSFGGNNGSYFATTEEYNSVDFGSLTKFGNMTLNLAVY